MKFNRSLRIAAIGLVASLLSAGAGSTAPLTVQTQGGVRDAGHVVAAGWRGGGWHYGRHYDGWRYRYQRHYGWGPAIGGFAAGAAIGGAIANSRAQALENDAYCSRRFKSYDPRSGTYLGYDGQRHPCP
ncbi:BA14K family protein [Bradyrhizobium sp. USDA 10063]